MTNTSFNAVGIFSSLTTGRRADRFRALEALDNGTRTIERDRLRELILGALTGEFEGERGLREQDEEVTRTRRWLLRALGRLIAEDQEAEEFVEENINPDREPDAIVRY